MRAAALVVLASCSGPARPPPVPPPQPAPADATTASQPPPDEPEETLRPHGTANDDLPHRHAQLAPLLASATTCIPRADLLGPDDEPIALALDTFDDHLVVCAQVTTRRDVSVFFDPVSYACWDVDPKTANLTRRADLARAYFRCQDGSCPPGSTNRVISYDGTEALAFDDALHTFAITTRAGAPVASFPRPPDFAGREFLRGELTSIAHTTFAVTEAGTLVVLDARGTVLDHLANVALGEVHVMDATHVLAATADRAMIYDLTTNAHRIVKRPGKLARGAVRFRDKLYAIDDARALALLDATFAVTKTRPLATCP
jgi:hypothetical protein